MFCQLKQYLVLDISQIVGLRASLYNVKRFNFSRVTDEYFILCLSIKDFKQRYDCLMTRSLNLVNDLLGS